MSRTELTMSPLTRWAWVREAGVRGSSKAVLFAITSRANRYLACRVTVAVLAKDAGYSPKKPQAVRDAIRRLESGGFIRITGTLGMVRTYHLTPSGEWSAPGLNLADGVPPGQNPSPSEGVPKKGTPPENGEGSTPPNGEGSTPVKGETKGEEKEEKKEDLFVGGKPPTLSASRLRVLDVWNHYRALRKKENPRSNCGAEPQKGWPMATRIDEVGVEGRKLIDRWAFESAGFKLRRDDGKYHHKETLYRACKHKTYAIDAVKWAQSQGIDVPLQLLEYADMAEGGSDADPWSDMLAIGKMVGASVEHLAQVHGGHIRLAADDVEHGRRLRTWMLANRQGAGLRQWHTSYGAGLNRWEAKELAEKVEATWRRIYGMLDEVAA